MGLWEAITGRSRPPRADLDALFLVPYAVITLQAAAGLRPAGDGSVCYRAATGAGFHQTQDEILALLRGAGARGLSVDLDVLAAAGHDVLAEALEAGERVALGVVPSLEPATAPTTTGLTERVLRWLDLAVLALALPAFVALGIVVGWAFVAGTWLVLRAMSPLLRTRARAAEDPRRETMVLAIGMMARVWILALAILGAGLIDRKAGLAAALLSIVLVTVNLVGEMTRGPVR
jgi:hypothetical protein